MDAWSDKDKKDPDIGPSRATPVMAQYFEAKARQPGLR